jgi:KpsF/GutQ family protein
MNMKFIFTNFDIPCMLGNMDRSYTWDRAVSVWRHATMELGGLASRLDKEAFLTAVKVIAEANGRIITFGAGTSGATAKKIAHSLSCIERPAFFLSPADAVHGALGAVQNGDIAILLSKGGNTSEIVALIPALKKKKNYIIVVTENEHSTLAANADLLLKVTVSREADNFNMLATTSAMTVTAVFDALCILVMELTGFTRKQFALIHPGGAVGERLINKGDEDE